MERDTRKNKVGHWLALGALVTGLGACAHSTSRELVHAREAYDDAASSPARTRRPNELEAARVALDRAEQAHHEDPGSSREQRLAIEAERKARLAHAHGDVAEAEREATEAEREAAAARAHAEDAERARRNEAQRDAREERAEERADRVAASRTSGGEGNDWTRERRGTAALQNLASVATVREEPRGVVITLAGSLLFPSGQRELSPIARQNLNQVAEALSKQPEGTKFQVSGHTDNSGAPAQNKQLSTQRAKAVADQLAEAGIDRDRIEVEGYGEARPIVENNTPEGQASNRRVEILVANR